MSRVPSEVTITRIPTQTSLFDERQGGEVQKSAEAAPEFASIRFDTPTTTEIPTSTPPKLRTITMSPTNTPGPTLPPTSTNTPTATIVPTPVYTSTPVDGSLRPDNLKELRIYMLSLINEERTKTGLNPLRLGNNEAAQLHAEDMLRQGYLSHWNTEGLKPYMRYALSGGEGVGAENASGPTYFVEPCKTKACLRDPFEQIDDHMEGLMSSIGHRWNILNDKHVFANLGIAYNGHTSTVVQQFEGNYLQYVRKPQFEDRMLKLEGVLFYGLELVWAELHYDPLPKPLTLGQLGRTYCYGTGEPITLILEPGYYFPEETLSIQWGGVCTDPYSIDPHTPAPSREEPDLGLPSAPRIAEDVPWIIADKWTVNNQFFDLQVDLSTIIESHGYGVYTVILWAGSADDPSPVSEYPIFYGDP